MSDYRITPFLYGGDTTVRVINENDRESWVTADVCRAIGVPNPSDAVKGLDEDEKGLATIYTLDGPQRVGVVYESGLWALVLKSRKEDAARFRKWITSEVIPSVRRTGSYVPEGQIILQKPDGEMPFEERRAKLATVNTTYRIMGRGAAVWMWQHEGLPMPPPNLLPGWWQGNLLG